MGKAHGQQKALTVATSISNVARTVQLKTKPQKITFSFGRNWQRFVERSLSPERERIAITSIRDFLEISDLNGRSFLDVGCGSGLFSLAALRLGARQIVSFDVDPFSVRCCEELKSRAGNPGRWQVLQGSILDEAFLARIGKADIVYAWGSLHHTGDMWKAIRHTANLVETNGLFYLSIYNKVTGRKGSDFWLRVKKLYNRSPQTGKRVLEGVHFFRNGVVRKLASFENPMTLFTQYSRERGMSYWTDVRDWLGGYPYEFASTDEIFRFATRELRMELVNLRSTNTLGTNEFLFHRRD
ncbi:MAG: class I SAM-dependent methyltransferase [Terriglobia bacterium]